MSFYQNIINRRNFKMMNLTDMELCMLEQLTYLDEDVRK